MGVSRLGQPTDDIVWDEGHENDFFRRMPSALSLALEATDLESLQLYRIGGTKYIEQYWRHTGWAIRQPVVTPPYDTRDLTDIATELAARVGILDRYLEADELRAISLERGVVMVRERATNDSVQVGLVSSRSWFIGAHCTAETSRGQLGASMPNCLAYEAGGEALPLWEEIWPGPAPQRAKSGPELPHSSQNRA